MFCTSRKNDQQAVVWQLLLQGSSQLKDHEPFPAINEKRATMLMGYLVRNGKINKPLLGWTIKVHLHLEKPNNT